MQYACRLFGISRQGYYQNQKRKEIKALKLSRVKELVQHERNYLPRVGTRKLFFMLKDEFKRNNIKIGRDGLFDYLRYQHMLVRPQRAYHKTTNSKHWLRKHPNLTKEYRPDKAEQLWVADITYIDTREKTGYLSLITDAYSRKIVGHYLHDSLHTDGVKKALEAALKTRIYDHPLIHHSDRGIQYCSSSYQELQKEYGIQCSMTDGYDCYQNALAERINGIIKHEFLIVKPENLSLAKTMIDQSIKLYNQRRPHLALNYQTPDLVHKKVLVNLN